MQDRFVLSAPCIVCCRRVLELQALAAPGPHSIGAFHPAIVGEQLIGCRWIKLRSGRIRLITRVVERAMVGAQWRGQAMVRLLDQGLVIDRHRLAHSWMGSQHHIVKVERHPLEGGTGSKGDERIVSEALVRLDLARIQEPGRRDGPGLEVL